MKKNNDVFEIDDFFRDSGYRKQKENDEHWGQMTMLIVLVSVGLAVVLALNVWS